VWLLKAARGAGRVPVTVAALAALLTLAVATGSFFSGPSTGLVRHIGAGLGPFGHGRWWVLVTSALWCAGLAGYLVCIAVILVALPWAERRIGSARTALILGVTQVLGVASGLVLVQLIGLTGGRWAHHLSGSIAVDPAGVVLGVALAASAAAPVLWRRRVRLVILVALVTLALYSGTLPDLLRLTTGLAGLAVGILVLPRERAVAGPSRPEIRVLVALVVAASALGPLAGAVTTTGMGPFSVLRYLLAAPPPEAHAVQVMCAHAASTAWCANLHAKLRLSGLGPAILTIMPALLLLISAEGLRRGRRAAWFAAVSLQVVLAGLGVLLAVTAATTSARDRSMFGPHLHGWIVLTMPFVQPLLVAALLVACRRGFGVRAPAGTYRRWALLAGVTLAAVSAVYVLGSLLAAGSYDRAPDLRALLIDLPARFVPPWYLGEIEPGFLPDRPPAVLLYEWTGVVFWGVAGIAGLLTFVRPELPAQDATTDRVRALLATHGGDNLAHMTTWAGNSYWFTDDGKAAIAYRVIGGVALTTGAPVGDPWSHADALYGFIAHCHRAGWTPCLYSIGASTVAWTRSMGWHDVQVAEETVLELPGLKFTGKPWQDVRTTLNHAARAGITAEWIRYSTAPRSITDQIRVISQAWVADKGLPELGFTLGGLAELADDEVRLLIAVDADRTVHGVTSWLPVYREGHITGWTLDFMRRRTDGFRGSMEFLIASAALNCQAEGAQFLSLSGAPLARLDRGQPAAGLQRTLDLAGKLLEPVYGFRSLFAFKEKFQPRHQPLYLAYPDPAALPAIGNAIGRAYLPHLTPRELTRLARQLLR
jgi:lysylphosphatidylglycerol synthetase-like protein (DUF2156 family)